ncbi:uncharacterized protein LOC121372655 [Gigantopelta aegis]|uniref:uncharacterized protein LOC121372655 n=1 Tax=Gigantopelta aegis TaxID=1735272 RepID=UPI001B88818E|nr:uncharacterized protein LOC121372655 [Gigantopelta aegis]
MSTLLVCAFLFFSGLIVVSGKLSLRDGVLVDIIDDCDPHDPNSCGSDKCCVKDGIMYIPEATGPRPAYRIECRPLTTVGRLCYLRHSTEMCPCGAGLTCKASSSFFGHCH